jgi:hypothetical protein
MITFNASSAMSVHRRLIMILDDGSDLIFMCTSSVGRISLCLWSVVVGGGWMDLIELEFRRSLLLLSYTSFHQIHNIAMPPPVQY